MTVKFTIYGEPQGKGRPIFSKRGKFVSTRTPDKTVLYENQVKTAFENQCGIGAGFSDGAALDMRIIAYYSIPKSISKKKAALMLEGKIRPAKKPDADNIAKVIADSLNKIAYRDDSQIADMQIRKFYSDTPRVVVSIQELTG